MKAEHEKYMRLALLEARKGLGRTSPNPCVGAVIVKSGEIVGVGYHKKAGTPHAEIHALADAGDRAEGATIYVTLEPCSHYGKTPSCCEAVAEAGIVRVVIGMLDPNPLVNGRGVAFLKDKGIEVVATVCEDECIAINRPFVKMITTGLPWMIMNAGVSLDGRLNYQKGSPGWITGKESKEKVHKLRDQVDAIMVGSSTVKIDNPSLTTRLGNGEGKNPIRVILDSKLSTSIDAEVYQSAHEVKTIVFCAENVDQVKEKIFLEHGVEIVKVSLDLEGKIDLLTAMKRLVEFGINSVLVEGGSTVHGEMLKQQLYDYAYLFYAPVFAGCAGVSLTSGHEVENRDKRVVLNSPRYTQLGDDIMIEGFFGY